MINGSEAIRKALTGRRYGVLVHHWRVSTPANLRLNSELLDSGDNFFPTAPKCQDRSGVDPRRR